MSIDESMQRDIKETKKPRLVFHESENQHLRQCQAVISETTT